MGRNALTKSTAACHVPEALLISPSSDIQPAWQLQSGLLLGQLWRNSIHALSGFFRDRLLNCVEIIGNPTPPPCPSFSSEMAVLPLQYLQYPPQVLPGAQYCFWLGWDEGSFRGFPLGFSTMRALTLQTRDAVCG